MVRMYKRIIKKRYLNHKAVYLYHYVALPIPKKFQEQLKPYFGRDLGITVDVHAEKITIILTPKPEPWQKPLVTKKTPSTEQQGTTPVRALDEETSENVLKYQAEETPDY